MRGSFRSFSSKEVGGRASTIVLALLLGSAAAPSPPAPIRLAPIRLAPPATEVGFRAYAFGMVPIDGTFTRFQGQLGLDAGLPGACLVDVSIDTASLFIADRETRDDVISPAFLDAGAYPAMIYRGRCAEGGVRGELTLHGQTHPLLLNLAREDDRLIATGIIRRAEWGITARPILAGPTVRIRVSIPAIGGAALLTPGTRR